MPDTQTDAEPDRPAAEQQSGTSRARLAFAGGLAAVLVAVVVVVLVAGSGSTQLPDVPDAPPECVTSWNDDRNAVAFGVHNSTAHGYSDVQVALLTEDGTEPADGEDTRCTVIFGRSTLDPEPGAAGQVLVEDRWVPLSERGIEINGLTQLQSKALRLANAELQPDGTIVVD